MDAMNILETIGQATIDKVQAERPVPRFEPGDTLRVHVKVQEGNRERLQVYEGRCIGRKNAGVNSSFTVRKISFGEGVERVFPLYGPGIWEIEVVRKGVVRRAKLYYLRDLRSTSSPGVSCSPSRRRKRPSGRAARSSRRKSPRTRRPSVPPRAAERGRRTM